MPAITPDQISAPLARYSHGFVVPEGQRLIVTSGQLALAGDGSIPDGARAQAELILRNIDAILAAAGASAKNVFKISAYVTDRSHMAGYMAARDAWLEGVRDLPASTLMIVSGFTRPEFVVEIEVMAAVPSA